MKLFENNYRSRLKLTNDQVFYWVYGMDTEESKRALIALLNVVLDRKDDPIVEVRLLNPVQKGFVIGDKLTVMDVKCETSSGELIDVEMQRSLRSLLQSLSLLRCPFRLARHSLGRKGKTAGFRSIRSGRCFIT